MTLHRRDGELRGCVGLMRSDRPLLETVARMAVAAAIEDGRFDPVTEAELDGLTIEISALGPLEPIRPEEVEVGRHGLLIGYGGRRGVLLPQVPVEHGLGPRDLPRPHLLEGRAAGRHLAEAGRRAPRLHRRPSSARSRRAKAAAA